MAAIQASHGLLMSALLNATEWWETSKPASQRGTPLGAQHSAMGGQRMPFFAQTQRGQVSLVPTAGATERTQGPVNALALLPFPSPWKQLKASVNCCYLQLSDL